MEITFNKSNILKILNQLFINIPYVEKHTKFKSMIFVLFFPFACQKENKKASLFTEQAYRFREKFAALSTVSKLILLQKWFQLSRFGTF